jgi:hypothetical protein
MRLMSFWTRPIVAAKNAVVAPKNITTAWAFGASSNSGDNRATMKTPAVTMVAAWISAETGVGPSIASGNQVCSRNWADLPIAPMNSRRQVRVSASAFQPRKLMVLPVRPGAAWKMVSKSVEPTSMNTAKMPSAKPKSPTRLTTKALIAAALADGFWYQKPIRR